MAWANRAAKWDHDGTHVGGLINYLVDTTSASATATRFYEGTPVVLDANGYPEPGGNALGAGEAFAGICAKDVTWTAGEANVYVPVWTEGVFNFYHASAAQTDVGTVAELSSQTGGTVYDTLTGADYGTSEMPIGLIVGVVGSTIWRVRIDGVASAPIGLTGWNEVGD
ncbi:MAG: hypothetical protein FJ280_30575 [Planctomycetes bacterium]|nr:hypothetical protein [Planctomycetota bacterium]